MIPDTFAPWLIDLVLAITLLEWAVLVYLYRLRGRGLAGWDVTLGLAPGLLLMVALKLSAPQSLPWPVMVALAAAGLAHALDFYRRYRRINSLKP